MNQRRPFERAEIDHVRCGQGPPSVPELQVALCVERNTRRQVAMKRILAEAAQDPSRRARFVEEGQVTAQLQHPNIVPVYELDRDAHGTIYFTMKPVRGRSLGEILLAVKEGKEAHSLGDLLGVFLKVCDGVAFAHSRGVVHRDLKPANLMVGDFGEVLVMDWGLAKIVGREDIRADDLVTSDRAESTPELTLDGTAMGTPAYMPPEQANGELDKIDHRSDIYSLGAILYELLTLEKPVEGATPLVVLANAAHGTIVPPEQRTPGRAIPRELSAIAMQCLHKLRSRRYQSVTELQRDITLYLEGRSVSAAPDTFAQALVKLV
ncbi:serine/threonine-protein kinase, partial [Planctomycetota bacterium]